MVRRSTIFTLLLALAVAPAPAVAQIKPASSGARSFNAPEMRRYGSGFYRPNQPGQYDRPERRQPHDVEPIDER